MADPLSIVNALTSLRTASDMLKTLRSVEGTFEKADLKMKIGDLAEALAEARIAVLEAQDEIRTLQERIATLESAASSRAGLVQRDQVYWFMSSEGQESGPFCPRCFEYDQKRMPLSRLHSAMRVAGQYQCQSCKALY